MAQEIRKSVYVKGRRRFIIIRKSRARCGRKMVYDRIEALDAVARIGQKRDVLLRAYPCKRGDHWHLTSQI